MQEMVLPAFLHFSTICNFNNWKNLSSSLVRVTYLRLPHKQSSIKSIVAIADCSQSRRMLLSSFDGVLHPAISACYVIADGTNVVMHGEVSAVNKCCEISKSTVRA